MIMLWTGSAYLAKENKNHFISTIPAIFMTAVTFSYILQAPEGFRLPSGMSNGLGVLIAIIFTALFANKVKKLKSESHSL